MATNPAPRPPEAPILISRADFAEWSATIYGAIMGGLCLSGLDVQPVSATGAMLQVMVKYVLLDPKAIAMTAGLNDKNYFHLFVNFTIILFALATGTCLGRQGRLGNRVSKQVTVGAVPILSAIGFLVIAWFKSLGQPVPFAFQSLLCALFGSAIGVLWGVMPNPQSTTARSALLKRAALGDLGAVCQVIVFLMFVFMTTLGFHFLSPRIPIHLVIVGDLLMLFLILLVGWSSTRLYMRTFTEHDAEPEPPHRLATIAYPVLLTVCVIIACILHRTATDVESAAANEQPATVK